MNKKTLMTHVQYAFHLHDLDTIAISSSDETLDGGPGEQWPYIILVPITPEMYKHLHKITRKAYGSPLGYLYAWAPIPEDAVEESKAFYAQYLQLHCQLDFELLYPWNVDIAQLAFSHYMLHRELAEHRTKKLYEILRPIYSRTRS